MALATLFATQAVLGVLRQWRGLDRLMNRQPVLLLAAGELLHDNMRKMHVVEDEIRQVLRGCGIRRLEEVQAVVLERNGSVSVIRRETPVDAWLVSDVDGAHLLGANSADP